jgi:peptidoglycan/LPS O-acetylase OafA/YrhL
MQNHGHIRRSHSTNHVLSRDSRIPGLDGLRAIAVIAVVWHHAHPGFSGVPLSRHGFLGVDVFFVLSGFLITTLLIQEKKLTGHISLTSFYVRRSLRIFPLYYAVLAAMAIFFSASKKSANASAFFNELPWHVTYLSNWISSKSMMALTWSLSTEEQFYLVWPPVFAWLGIRALWLIFPFLAVNQGINFGYFDPLLNKIGIPFESLSLLQITFTPILMGVLLAIALQGGGVERFKQKISSWMLPVAAIAAIIFANIDGDIRGWPRLLFHLSTVLVIALIVMRPKSRVVAALERRPFTHIGMVSYGIYLFHMIILYCVHRVAGGEMLNYPVVIFTFALASCVVVATISYRLFELPLMRLKGRLFFFYENNKLRLK